MKAVAGANAAIKAIIELSDGAILNGMEWRYFMLSVESRVLCVTDQCFGSIGGTVVRKEEGRSHLKCDKKRRTKGYVRMRVNERVEQRELSGFPILSTCLSPSPSRALDSQRNLHNIL
jgi:hypothetical protein